jgi:cytochrome b561
MGGRMIDAIPTSAAAATEPGYTLTARVLHWLVAALVLTMVPLGIVIANEWGGSQQERLYDLHKSVGALLIPVVIVRLIYRLVEAPPRLPADVPAIQQFAAHATHWVLYALLLVQPLVGWIGTSAYPAPVPVFGWFNLPMIWWENRAFSDLMMALHRWLGIAIAVIAVIHIAAALQHHFVRKDRVLMRMLTG